MSRSVCLYDGTPAVCSVVDDEDIHDDPTATGAPRGNRVLAAAMQRARAAEVLDEFEGDESTARRLLDQVEREALGTSKKKMSGKNAAALRAALSELRSSSTPEPEPDAAKTQLSVRPEPSSFDARQTQVARASNAAPTLDSEQTQVAVKVPPTRASLQNTARSLPPLPDESGPDLSAHDATVPRVPTSTDEIPLIADADVESDVIDSAQTALATGDLRDPSAAAAPPPAPPRERPERPAPASPAEPGLSFEPLVVVEGDALGTGEIAPQDLGAQPDADHDDDYDDRDRDPYDSHASAGGTMVIARSRVTAVTELVEAPPNRLRPRWMLWGVIALGLCLAVGVAVYIASAPDLPSSTSGLPPAAKGTTRAAVAPRVDSAARAPDARSPAAAARRAKADASSASASSAASADAGARAQTVDATVASSAEPDAAAGLEAPDAAPRVVRHRRARHGVAVRRRRTRRRRATPRRRRRRHVVHRRRRHPSTKAHGKHPSKRELERTIDPFKE